jgi:hypothetical protein
MQPSQSPPPQLDEEHLRQLADARIGIRKIVRAASMARLEGIILAVFAALGLISGYDDATNVIVSLSLGVIAFVELRGATQLRQLNPAATKTLTWNQVGLGTVLIIYSVKQIISTMSGHGALTDLGSSSPELSGMIDTQNLSAQVKSISIAFYGVIIAGAILFQGGMALYYRSRRKFLQTYLQQTPAWIIAMQRAGMSI